MLKNSKILILIFLISISFTVTCVASDNITKINDLIEKSASLNNTEITVQGEVIGEALERGKYAWININDTTNAIGIWVKQSDVDMIKFYGDYKHRGDIVKVTGVFYKSCPEHGGDVDIHSTHIEVIETGHEVTEEISHTKVLVTAVLFITMLIFYKLFRHKAPLT